MSTLQSIIYVFVLPRPKNIWLYSDIGWDYYFFQLQTDAWCMDFLLTFTASIRNKSCELQ